MTAPGGSPPPGWYPDPGGSGGQRWWDGGNWAATAAPGPGAPVPAGGTDGFAITSLVTSLLGIPIVPVVFGHLARGRIKRSGGIKTGNGLALAGLIIGYLALAFWTLIIVLAATGNLETKNEDDFSGAEKDVAVVIDKFEQAADDEDYSEICNEILTREFADAVASVSSGSCENAFKDELDGKRQAEIDAKSITVTGDSAVAEVDEEGTDERITFVRDGDSWRISNIENR
jgi:hypothetical protein